MLHVTFLPVFWVGLMYLSLDGLIYLRKATFESVILIIGQTATSQISIMQKQIR